MQLIAFRAEYQITVDGTRNRIFYKPFTEMHGATGLPHYLEDWEQALREVQPGFTILTDVTAMQKPNPSLWAQFVAAQELIVRRGVSQVAEVHLPSNATRDASEAIRQQSGLPVRRFVDLWEADGYLDQLASDAGPG